MDKKISQKNLEKELDKWISNVSQDYEVVLGKYYLDFWESEGYNIKKYREVLNITSVLIFMPYKQLNMQHN